MTTSQYVTYDELNRTEERINNRINDLVSVVHEARSETTAVYNLAVAMKDSIDQIKADVTDLTAQYATPDSHILALNIRVDGLDQRTQRVEGKVDRLDERVGRIEQDINEIKETHGTLLRLIVQALNIQLPPNL